MHTRLTHLFFGRFRLLATRLAIPMLLALVLTNTAFAGSTSSGALYKQINLTSDIPGLAKFTDPNLVNPWGISFAPTNPFWLSDNNSGLSTLYNGKGKTQSLVVTIPPAKGGKTGSPTGTVFSSFSGAFIVTAHGKSGTSGFLFASEDGTISGWNPTVDQTHAIIAVDNSGSGAVYKGLALATVNSQPFLYAANFHSGTIDVFNKKFAPAKLQGSFQDSGIPVGYAPFNIQSIGSNLYVTYAKQDKAKHDDVPGSGFLDVYDDNGNLVKRLVSHGPLNAPWGVALAPTNFGQFSNDLLVGNFGNGYIHAFNPTTGAFLGTLMNSQYHPIHIDGLWALAFGGGGASGQPNQLFFTAGIQKEQHGLFGMIETM
ncbi:MAG TPA: TIGR03118 family protein [Ktedonobacteraceae bacterium]|nr:TIGR03118 family protein [Ktedonobacteraceae bacterium]